MVPRLTKAPRVSLQTNVEQPDVNKTSQFFAAQMVPIAVSTDTQFIIFSYIYRLKLPYQQVKVVVI